MEQFYAFLEVVKPKAIQVGKSAELIESLLARLFQECFEANDIDGMLQFGSILAEAATNREHFDLITGKTIPKHLFTQINDHMRYVGVGKPLQESEKSGRNQEHRVKVVIDFVGFLLECGMASAKVRLTKQGLVPQVYRSQSSRSLIHDFIEMRKNLVARSGEKMVAIRTQDLFSVVKVVCPQKLKCLAALDVLSETAGRLNFAAIQSLLPLVVDKYAGLKEDAEAIMKTVAGVYVKTKFVSRDQMGVAGNENGNLGCACHCSYFAFGRVDGDMPLPHPENASKCGHVHPGGCSDCESLPSFRQSLNEFIVKVKAQTPSASTEDNKLVALLNYRSELFTQYVGHKARLCHKDARIEGASTRSGAKLIRH
jgi:hypothetical protein